MRQQQSCIGHRQQRQAPPRLFEGEAERQHHDRQHRVGGELGEGAARVGVEQMIGRRHVGDGADQGRRPLAAHPQQPGVHREPGQEQDHGRGHGQAIRHRQRIGGHDAHQGVDPERQGRIEIEGGAAQAVERFGHPARIEDAGAELLGELARPGEVLRRAVADQRAQHQRRRQQQHGSCRQDEGRMAQRQA